MKFAVTLLVLREVAYTAALPCLSVGSLSGSEDGKIGQALGGTHIGLSALGKIYVIFLFFHPLPPPSFKLRPL